MLMNAQEYAKAFHKYYIVDCAVRDRNAFSFALDRVYTDAEVEEEEENNWDRSLREKRLVTFFRDGATGDRLAYTNFQSWGPLELGAMTVPKTQSILYEGHEGRVYVAGSGSAVFEKPLNSRFNSDSPMHAGVGRIKSFNGKAFLCGGYRGFAKRLGPDLYRSHMPLLDSLPLDHPDSGREGFDDFDMFSENDIYAAGGRGDLWHFDGTRWRQLALPTNTWLNTVCCGADGMVYISGYQGLTFMGRGDKWKQIHPGGIYLGWKDMVWFEDRAWASSENGLWTIKDGQVELQNHQVSSEISVCSGNLYVEDGVMLMAGLGGACFRENGKWHSIFTDADMGKLLLDESK